MATLYKQFLYFIRKIRSVNPGTPFTPHTYFHGSFLNGHGRIAPNQRAAPVLEKAFRDFFETFRELPQAIKDEIYRLVLNSTRIDHYFEDITVVVTPLQKDNINNLVGNDSLENLMSKLWLSLKSTAWDIDLHYKEFYEGLNTKTCAFCGINQFPNPESYRADYDHLAYKGLYPLTAISLKNLAPSCSECNSKIKLQKDVFHHEGTHVRRAFNYPFVNFIPVEVRLDGTVLPQTVQGVENGMWTVNFVPDNDVIENWAYTYDIRRRFITEVLEVDYSTWLGNFKKELREYGIVINSYDEIKNYFRRHAERYGEHRLQKRYIVKSSFFKYLEHCNNDVFYNQMIAEINP